MRPALVLAIAIAACGGRVDGDSDASPVDGGDGGDASKKDDDAATTTDGSSTSPPDAAIVTCGPNTCHAGEICCNAKCGVCTFPGECVIHDCGGP